MSFDNNMQLISQTIKQKERELQEIHEMRCTELEKMILERDQLLIESSKRFEKLKEDFQYNLTLIEARDVEIERLEKMVYVKDEQGNRLESDLHAAILKYDLLEKKFDDSTDRYSNEKTKSKQVLNELREVVESMQWASSEESKSKSKEIESLKADIRRLTLNREESLESQRKDITTAFELILHQREESFSTKEVEINNQISLLATRLEQISTDNATLKAQLHTAHRKIDDVSQENINKDDTIRKLQWKLEDERGSKQESDEVLHRNLQQTAFELSSLRVALNTESQENKLTSDKMERRLAEITNSREELEKEYDASRKRWSQDKADLEMKIESITFELESKAHDVTAFKEKIMQLNESNSMIKEKMHVYESDLQRYHQENSELQDQILSLQDKDHDMAEKITSLKLSHLQAIRSLEVSHDREKKSLESHYQTQIHDIRAEMDMKQMEYDIKLTSIESELTTISHLLEEKTKALDDEKAGGAALLLRLQLLENQMTNLRQKHDRESNLGSTSSSSSAFNLLHNDSANYPRPSSYEPNRLSYPSLAQGGHSPAFSEDMGPASISRLSGHAFDSTIGDNNNNHNADMKLVDENESLKKIIKEMRLDIENLQSNASPHRAPGRGQVDDDRSDILERRLEQMTDEVNRLRQERRKLLDNSNELRAALNMKAALTYESNQPPVPPESARPTKPSPEAVGSHALSSSLRPSSAPDMTSRTLFVEGTTAGAKHVSISNIPDVRSAERIHAVASNRASSYRKPPSTIPTSTTPTSSAPTKPQNAAASRRVMNYNALRDMQA